MENITETAEQLLPDLEPAPDTVFGDGDVTGYTRDAEALWRLVTGQEVSYFALPVLVELCRRPYHAARVQGPLDVAKLARDHQSKLVRSDVYHPRNDNPHVDRLLFRMAAGVFAIYDASELSIFAPTPQAAAEVARLMKSYRKPQDEKPGFRLVSFSCGQPSAQLIGVKQAAPVQEQELALHYGDDFLEWERTWLERLRQRSSGVSVLFGPPGCGKTSYIRGLMSRLIGKFEFYYIPVSAFNVLTSPTFVSFWIEQKGDGCRKHRVAIMEDAEELLLPRNAGNQTDVSNLLNIGDGFLGEHLNLHVIATTNSPIRQLDPALLRPGRLMGTREFRRLTRSEAQRLADAKGLALSDQSDFSLAELYCGQVSNPALNVERQIGFAQ